MLTVIIFILLASAVSFFVILPIVQSRLRGGVQIAGHSNHNANDLVARKETIYAAIKDIEFDYEMGKLSEEDFKELRQQYKNEAVNLLQKIDGIEGRQVKPKPGQAKNKKNDSSINFCWLCGTGATASDKFCANCGNKLT